MNELNVLKNMIYTASGHFFMGHYSAKFSVDHKPIHKVCVNAFHICRFPVTQELWYNIMNYNPQKIKIQLAPVTFVSWYDAVNFCNKFSAKYNFDFCYKFMNDSVECNFKANGFRLPTEAEWEFAAKGGNDSKDFLYSGSNNINQVAWYKNNSKDKSHDVGLKQPNTLGLYDMSGNIWEWCWDWYARYTGDDYDNPSGPLLGTTKTYRGGSYIDFDYACTVFARGRRIPKLKQSDIGFRIVRSKV